MRLSTNKYESEVHFGLLVIILIMLAVNLASNYVIYTVRDSQAQQVQAQLQQAAIGITRAMDGRLAVELPTHDIEELRRQFGLSSLIFAPARPPADDPAAKRQWLGAVVDRLPPGQLPEFARKLMTSHYQTLSGGDGAEYFLVYPATAGNDKYLMILGQESSRLAQLDNARNILLWVSLTAIAALALVYLVVSRHIFLPMRLLRREAKQAGRQVRGDDETAALIEDYRRIIAELQEKERDLIAANEQISIRADSLEQYNRYLLQSMTSGLFTVDMEGRVQSINVAATRMLDLHPMTQAGRHYRELLVCDETLGDGIERLLADGTPVGYREVELATPTGRSLVLGLSCSAVLNDSDKPIGAAILIQDLTELRSLQQQLESRNRMAALGELTGGLAHQLRNSMGAMVGYARLLQKRIERGEAEPHSVTAMLTEAEEAETLIERFLSFSRPLEPEREPVSLYTLLTDIADSHKIKPDARHVDVKVECDPDLTIYADPLLLKQAIGNLVQNGVEAYAGAVGVVLVSAVADSESVIIQVADQAGGIPDDRRESIFTPFYSSRPSGTGLGLPVAARLVDLHSGSLTLKSSPGEGSTTFTITLPQHDSRFAPAH